MTKPSQTPIRWLYVFLAAQFVCQTALLLPLGQFRLGFRALTFGSSLAMWVFLPGNGANFPYRGMVLAAIGITSAGMLHPNLNSPLSGIAQCALTTAIWAPALWVTRVEITTTGFGRLVFMLWAFNTASSLVGVLQVYYPEYFAPDPEFVRRQLGVFADGLRIRLDDGRDVWRPFGLTDSPGGAATSGTFAALSGIAFIVSDRRMIVAGLASVFIGLFCIYVSHVRSALVITGAGMIGMIGVAVVRGRTEIAVRIALLVALSLAGGFAWAVAIGGDSVTARFETLVSERPDEVYHKNRGKFLETALSQDLFAYPLGAGLGRWGMMSSYFGDPSNVEAFPLWVEIQPSAWIFDGGILLLAVGYISVVAAGAVALRIAVRARNEGFAALAALIAAFDFGILVQSFSYAVFISQTGMMFWFLNAALFAASCRDSATTSTDRRPSDHRSVVRR